MDTKTFKRELQRSENYHRKGFGHEAEVADTLKTTYQSHLIQQLRENQHTLKQGQVTIRLAEAFGFCWGVELGVHRTFETRTHFPHKRIWINQEIIHNPSVNQ
ncbi:MAG: 4-hydroxy-3-methylbut-2-enyl diphosphate reductase, partial [Synechococcales cyanobacterium]